MIDLNASFYGDITNGKMIDLLTVAFEGGCDYWLGGVPVDLCTPIGKNLDDYKLDGRRCWYLLPVCDGCVCFMLPDEPWLYLDRIDLIGALEKLENLWPNHFQDIINDDDDGETADLVLQLAMMGEVVYG